MKAIASKVITLAILLSADSAFAQPTPPDGGDGCTNCPPPTNYFAPLNYGSNLWISVGGIASNSFFGILTNSEPDIQYEIQSIGDLTQTNWNSEGFIFGSEITNWTALSVNLAGRTNGALFFRVRSWIDSYDMGIPDWWQIQYFGMTGINPDGDPAGDGYSNLYKFQHGMNPLISYAPQSPAFTVTPTANDSGETVSWNPAQGAVTGYTVYRNGSAIATVSVSTFSYTDSTAIDLTDPNDSDFPVYTVQANYSGNEDASPEEPPFNPRLTISPAIVRGAQGQYILLVPNIPSGVASIRLYLQPSGADYPDVFFSMETYQQPENYFMPSSTTNIIDVPAGSFTTNGEYAIPASLMPLFGTYGNSISCRAIGADGTAGPASTVFQVNIQFPAETEIWGRIPFMDGREQLKENLAFQLEAADELGSFGFYVDGAEGAVNFPQNYAFANYYFPLDFGSSQYNYAFLDPFKPFEDNYFYRNFVYAFTNLNSNGSLASGAFFDSSVQIPYQTLFSFDEYDYVATGNTNLLAPQMSATANQWLYSPYQPKSPGQGNIGISQVGTNLFLNSGQANVFGLQYQSAIQAYSNGVFLYTNRLNSGAGGIPDEPYYSEYFYGQMTPPQLQTVGYYFAIPFQTYLPGHVGFNPNSFTNSIMITAVGQESLVTAWAQQEIVNGASGKFGFLQQYFDKAYLADDGGNFNTNNQTGILSEYGEFFATDAGKTFLTTKSDGGNQGQFPVYSIALCTDANHDGVIDPSFGSPDFTSPGHPFRFWINDNNDSDDTKGNDIPGYPATVHQTPNGMSGHVNGVRDLVDFFPVYIDIQSLLQVMQTNSQYAGLQFVLSQADGALNVLVATNISPDDPLSYLTDTNVAASLANAPVTRIPPTGILLGTNTLAGMRDFNESILLCEATNTISSPLVLDVFQGTTIIAESKLYLNITGVEQMFRHKNLTAAVTGATNGPPDRLNDSDVPNEPDTGGNNFIFVHGYNTNPNEARGWESGIFKRLFWSGSHAKFYGVTWDGYSTQNKLIGLIEYTPNFQTNVVNAFLTAPYLAGFINSLSGTNTLAAHSLGNMVALSALNDYGANVQNYFMLDAAVPMEAIDGTVGVNTNMIYPDWAAQSYDSHLWASDWYQLWPGNDARSTLTWNNRLSNFNGANVYNFYSSGEEVLRTWPGGSIPSTFLGIAVNQIIAYFQGQPGYYAWTWQEIMKGRMDSTLNNSLLSSDHGGWRFNSAYSSLTVSQANALSGSELQTNAFFDFSAHSGFTADLALEGSGGSAYAAANRNRILSDAIPAVTLPVGANPVPHNVAANFDMQALYENGWPSGRPLRQVGQPAAGEWHHSDIQVVAYLYTYQLFNQLVTLGNLK
jgi:pimeloyl-ACP methyl ester carboxylesterase